MIAEEKLLKLIRKKPSGEGAPQSSMKTPGGKNSFSFGGLFIKSADILLLANRLVIFVIIVIIGYIVYKFYYLKEPVASLSSPVIENPFELTAGEGVLATELGTKPFSYYQEKMKSRDLFILPWDASSDTQAKEVPLEISQKLKLVGIVLDRDPQAIMEDLGTNQTVFLSKGQTIYNATLTEIKEDKVIFLYNDEKIVFTP